jgi:hypothetical protein
VELGGTKVVKAAGAANGVEITTVYAAHDSTLTRDMLTEAQKKALEPDNISVSLGAPSGYVVKFTNGLKIYLSGDTALHSEMRTVVHDFHKVNLAVINLGPNAISSDAAAYAINELVAPVSVIVSHPNEGVTSGGKIKSNARTKQFVDLLTEATGSVSIQLCLSQIGTTVGLDLNFFRSGTPLTPLLSDLTTRDVDVLYVAEAIVDAANVYDGTTLRLDRLTGTRSGTGFVFGDIQALRSDNTFERWFDIEEDGAATVTLSPL